MLDSFKEAKETLEKEGWTVIITYWEDAEEEQYTLTISREKKVDLPFYG